RQCRSGAWRGLRCPRDRADRGRGFRRRPRERAGRTPPRAASAALRRPCGTGPARSDQSGILIAMCLALVAQDAHPRFAVVIAANRDEHRATPATPAAWWDEGWVAGRDLEAGGTWLGGPRTGRRG